MKKPKYFFYLDILLDSPFLSKDFSLAYFLDSSIALFKSSWKMLSSGDSGKYSESDKLSISSITLALPFTLSKTSSDKISLALPFPLSKTYSDKTSLGTCLPFILGSTNFTFFLPVRDLL